MQTTVAVRCCCCCVWCFRRWPVCNETHKHAVLNICCQLHNHHWKLLVTPLFFVQFLFLLLAFSPFHFPKRAREQTNKQMNRFDSLCVYVYMLIELINQHLLNVFNNWIFLNHYSNEMEWCLIFIRMYNNCTLLRTSINTRCEHTEKVSHSLVKRSENNTFKPNINSLWREKNKSKSAARPA